MCEARRHTANDEARQSCRVENLRTENPDATEPAPSRLPIDRLGACSPRRLLFLLPLFPPARWLWALPPQPRVSSSTPPRAFHCPEAHRVPSRKVHPRCCRRRMLASLLRSARLPMNRRVAAHALTERGPSFRACLHRMHRRLSCRKVHPRCCRSLRAGSKRLRASCEDLLDEMDIQEALTLALRVRRHQLDANTGNLRSSAQITAQIDAQISFTFRWIGSDMPTYPMIVYCICASMPQRSISPAPRGCARARRGT